MHRWRTPRFLRVGRQESNPRLAVGEAAEEVPEMDSGPRTSTRRPTVVFRLDPYDPSTSRHAASASTHYTSILLFFGPS
jgi:hypothetical protein